MGPKIHFDQNLINGMGSENGYFVQAFMHAWIAACKNSTTPSKVVIPNERFVISQTVFGGPCTSPKPIIFEVLGTVVASTDLSEFPTPEWVAFEDVDGLVLTGTGTFDGQGAAAWEYNDCKKNPSCVSLPSVSNSLPTFMGLI